MSVIIPNWNGRDLLGPCLESLYRQEFNDFATIVVDNGSNDGSVAFVQKNFPQVAIIRFKENRGFSVAVNAGIVASGSPYICLLNNDTEVDQLWLKEIVAALDANPDVGSVASKILFYFDPTSVNSAGDEFSWFGVAYQRRLMRGDSDLFNESTYVFSACAAAAVYRKQLFETIGLFDEAFFAYQEDVDIGFRAQLAGYRCLFVPTAIVHHKHRATSSRMPSRWFYLRERNKHFVVIKNLSGKLLLLCLPLVFLQELCSLFEAVWRGHLVAYLKARRDVWRYLPDLLRERRRIHKTQTVSDRYIRRNLSFREPFRILFYNLAVGRSFKPRGLRGPERV